MNVLALTEAVEAPVTRASLPDAVFSDLLLSSQASLMRYTIKLAARSTQTTPEDLQQEVMLRAWEHRSAFEPGSNFVAWLTTIAFNHMSSAYWRKAHRMVLSEDAGVNPEEVLVACHAPADMHVELKQVWARLDALPDATRAAMKAVVLGEPLDALAEKLQVPVGTLKCSIYRARQHLAPEERDKVLARKAATRVSTPGIKKGTKRTQKRRLNKPVFTIVRKPT